MKKLKRPDGYFYYWKKEDGKDVDDEVKAPFVPKKDIVIEKVAIKSTRN